MSLVDLIFIQSEHTFLVCVYSYSLQNYTDISGFSFELPAPDMKKNYAFRLRVKLECTKNTWGEWSPIKYWKNDTGKHVSVFWQLGLLVLCSLMVQEKQIAVIQIILYAIFLSDIYVLDTPTLFFFFF